jgi:glyoxalase family protein
MTPLLGIHHVTAIAGDPSSNVAFYAGVLGLRLVKKTVNFDDPETYHLYFGDEVGHPGTIMTFFPWPGAMRGRHGVGQLTVTSFAVPPQALGYWSERLRSHGVTPERTEVLGEEVLAFEDPDGLQLEIVGVSNAARRAGWAGGPVPAEHAIRGFAQVTVAEEGYEATARLLTEIMGFRLAAESGNRFRYTIGEGAVGTRVDVVCTPDAPPGRIAAGTVHHVAFRVAGDAEQEQWRERLAERGINVTPVLDRQYFRSIYYREPGGVLFEIATDPPGFTVDEPIADLGTRLQLPPRLERARARIEAALPPLVEAAASV